MKDQEKTGQFPNIVRTQLPVKLERLNNSAKQVYANAAYQRNGGD